MKAQKAKMKGNESPKGQNERKWKPKRPKWKVKKAQKAKMKGNEGQQSQNKFWRPSQTLVGAHGLVVWAMGGSTWRKNKKISKLRPPIAKEFLGISSPRKQKESKWKPKRPKWKEKTAQKAKMKGNERPKGQNERKWRPKRPKWKEIKPQKAKIKEMYAQKTKKLQNAAGLGADQICLNFIRKRAVFGNLWGGPRVAAQANKKWKEMKPKRSKWKEMQPKSRKWKRWTPKRPKWKEIKAQKAKMKWNEGPKGQDERKWRSKRPKWKEMKDQKAKMKGN